jgi:calcineurin-like phosphoesterase family protein
MKYFIADMHFCHDDVITFSDRPFKNVSEMNDEMIKLWNERVKSPDDEIYILGDFMYRGSAKKANEILKKLRGKKYLIRGNHEQYLDDTVFNLNNYEWVKDYYSFYAKGRKIILFHYPILEWDQYFNNSILLYGHVHDKRMEYFDSILGPKALNVGVDRIGFAPLSIDEVFNKIEEQEISFY